MLNTSPFNLPKFETKWVCHNRCDFISIADGDTKKMDSSRKYSYDLKMLHKDPIPKFFINY